MNSTQKKREQLRAPHPIEMDLVYQMGFDKWGDERTLTEHLEICRTSPKYKRGTWYVWENFAGELVSTAIIYPLDLGVQNSKIFGIGSVATFPHHRCQGYAENMLKSLMQKLQNDYGADIFVLWSDIDPNYYQKLGFEPLPPHLQSRPSSCLMMRTIEPMTINDVISRPTFVPPIYF